VSRSASGPVVLAFAAAGHSCAAALFVLQRGAFGLPPGWELQYFLLLSLSMVLHCLAAAWRGQAKSKAVYALAFGCYVLVGYPFPPQAGIQAALGMPLMLAAAGIFDGAEILVAGAAAMAATLLDLLPTRAWGVEARPAEPAGVLSLAFALALAFGLGLALEALAESRRRAVVEARRLDSAIDRIADVNASFQGALAAIEEESVRGERERVTREIHDIVGYALTNQQMMIEAALMLAPKEGRLGELLAMAREGVGEGLRETRRTLYALRQAEAAGALDFGVILKVARNFERVTGVRVSVDFSNARGDIGPEAWLALYRMIQESMINAFRHGKAASIAIAFREDAAGLHALVRDDGGGAGDMVEGIGLKGMRERIAALGGDFEARGTADGFVVMARFPRAAG
jgi:signal transduction histidine kinase